MPQKDFTPDHSIILYYQGYCGKCRFLSGLVVWCSLNFIKRKPLERDDSLKLFFHDHPKANGYPILFMGRRPVYNYWVFPAVPFAIMLSWFYSLRYKTLPFILNRK